MNKDESFDSLTYANQVHLAEREFGIIHRRCEGVIRSGTGAALRG
jgi:hypothetical protein